jgi:hypothetical protein
VGLDSTIAVLLWERDLPHLAALKLFHLCNRRTRPREQVNARQAEHQCELEHHLGQEIRRLEFAAKRAERQYDSVDPDNRLIASTLEKRWEDAMAELEQSKTRLAELKAQGPRPVTIPPDLRAAFADVGRCLPNVWGRLPVEARKARLRTLVSGVNLDRETTGIIRIRIAWRGGAVSERSVVDARSRSRLSRSLHRRRR